MIYVKRLLANDIPSGKQFAIPSYIADPFFCVVTEDGDWQKEITLSYINEDPDHPEYNDLTARAKLYPYPGRDESRLTVDINNLLRETLKAETGDILVLIQGRSDSDYSFRLVRKSDRDRYNTFSQLFVDAEKSKARAGGHALIDLDRSEDSDAVNSKQVWDYVKLLKENHNLILTGAPGTGKTHLAKEIAAYMIAKCEWKKLPQDQLKQAQFVQFHPSYDYSDFVEGIRPAKSGNFERKNGIFKEFCNDAIKASSFDLLYASLADDIKKGIITNYTTLSGNIYPLKVEDGIIKYGCLNNGTEFRCENTSNIKLLFDHFVDHPEDINYRTDALRDLIKQLTKGVISTLDPSEYSWTIKELLNRRYNKRFVFIIDEINRGELSKIFGELFYSIEPNYRGIKGRVKTQYNEMIEDKDDFFKDGFYVPDNVFLIGTMNDVDRSVESMDFAIRRRFVWKEVTAEESADNMGISGLARVKMNALNKALLDECKLTDAHCIGGAYFLKVKDSVNENDFKALWDLRLKGVISEYFRGDPEAQDKLNVVEQQYFSSSFVVHTDTQTSNVSSEKTLFDGE